MSDKIYNANFAIEKGYGFLRCGNSMAAHLKKHPGQESMGDIPAIIVNVSFSIELFLKALKIQDGHNPLDKHDYWILYTQLSLEVRDRLSEQYEKELESIPEEGVYSSFKVIARKETEDRRITETDNNPNLRDLLKSHRKAFKEWRYLFEFPEEGYEKDFNLRAMIAVAKAMYKVCTS